jgi:hypothetical protein
MILEVEDESVFSQNGNANNISFSREFNEESKKLNPITFDNDLYQSILRQYHMQQRYYSDAQLATIGHFQPSRTGN